MKILILGGTSLTGHFTTRSLIDQGHQVTIFHRGKHQIDLPPSVNRIVGERRKLDEFFNEFKQLSPDVVLDMLAFSRQDAEMLMRVFKGIAKRVVVPSSIDVYRVFGRLHGTEPGPVDPIPLAEEAPLREKLSIHQEEYQVCHHSVAQKIVYSQALSEFRQCRYVAHQKPILLLHQTSPCRC